MKRTVLAILCIITLLGGTGIVRAEEDPIFRNLKSEQIKSVMKNTVMIHPGAPEAYAHGKKYNMEKYGEAKRNGKELTVSSDFLNEVFPGNTADGEECDIYEFAKENAMTVTEKDSTFYISDIGYRLPSNLSNNINKLFGIYVKPGAKGTGTFESPVGSITSAKNMVSELKKNIGLPDGGISVYLRGGNYTVANTQNFDASDGGEEGSPICWRAYKDEKVSFDGGISIKGSEFQKITDSNIKNKLPYPQNVVCTNIGDRISAFGDSFRQSDPAMWSVFYRDTALNVARWPNNTEWALTGEIIDDGGRIRGKGFSFVVGDSRVKKWAAEDDPRIFGYFGFDWAGERRRIASVDRQKLSVTSDDFAEYGIAQNKRYYVYNMVCELDNPGEFYYDKKTDNLYFYPVEGSPDNEEFLNNEVQFSLLSQEMMSLHGASYMSFENIIFENALAMGMAVDSECRNIEIKGCTFKNITQGADLYGYDNTIKSCDFYNISNRPLGLFGGDRNTLTHSGNVIENNKFWNFNTTSRTNTSAIAVKGCGDRVVHNEVVGSPHTALVMGGNDNIVEYNEFTNNLIDGAEDAGVFYGGRNLSEQGNVYRCNYFHDNARNSIGVIYFDDGMSGNTVDTNVFENTGNGVFVHGGIGTEIVNNLFIGGTGSGAGFSSASNSWKMETATSMAANTLLWNLKQFPYESKAWQTAYQNVLKYLGSDEDPITMYDNVVSGNITIGKNLISAPEKDMAYMTIEDNTSVSAEDAKDYEVPEKYREIMENAGVYADEYRIKTGELGGFNLLRPYHKQSDVEASEVYFEWEKAESAYGYQFTLATDKDFKNVISNKIVTDNFVNLQKLNYFNTRYYWKVKAIANKTNSIEGDKEKYCNQDYYSFTTKKTEIISRDALYERIELCKGASQGITEGTNPGEYREGTAQMMKDLINEYRGYAEKPTITQKEINNYAQKLKSEFENLTYRRNPEMFNMASAIKRGNAWKFTPNQTVFGDDKLVLINQTSQTLGSADKISPHVYYKFKIKWDGYDNGWLGIGILAQGSQTAVPWSGNSMYFTILKKDTVEFQKWGSGANINNSYPNIYTKNNEWTVYELSALLQEDGSNLVTWKMDGKTVVEYTDTDNPITTPGYLYFYNGPKDARLEIMPVEE